MPKHIGTIQEVSGGDRESSAAPNKRYYCFALIPAQAQETVTFRCRINGGGEAGRTGAHDSYVIDAIWIDGAHQAEAARQFVLARIAQELSARAQNDWQPSRIDMKAFDQCFCRCVGLGIEQLVGLSVAT
jgi:hypothetical protein